MAIPEVAVFDLGKVLVDFDYGITARNLVKHCTITATEMQNLIDQTSLLYRYETGLMTTEEFYQEVKIASGYCRDLAEFSDVFGDIFTPIQPMIDLHATLRARGVPTYIFSNTNELAIRHIRRHFSFLDQFTGHILSYEHQAMKPDHKLYEVVERMTGKRGAALFYIDDRPENVATAHQRGWHAILHETPERTAVAVKASGLLG